MNDNEFGSFDGLVRDPLTALRADEIPGFDDPIAPDAGFAAALRDRLERGATLPKGVVMTDVLNPDTPVADVPANLVERPGALPYLTVSDARAAIDWYVEYLGATLRGEPILMDDNSVGHAELEIGGGVIYLADAFPDMGLTGPSAGTVSVSLMLPVADTDVALATTARGGAAVAREAYEAHGTRGGTIIDPFGHRWMLTGPSKDGVPASNRLRPGDIAYMSLQTPDVERAARFYGEVLGWTLDDARRRITSTQQHLGLSEAGDYGVNTVFCAYAVDDFDVAREAIVAAGGRAGAVTTAGDGVRVMDCTDDAGVAFAVYVPGAQHTRPDQHPRGAGEMSYLTILTTDSARLRNFYGATLGWAFQPGRMADGWEVANAHPQVGIAGGQDQEVAVPMWNVADIDDAVVRVRDAGGEVITAPETQAYGIMALCADDQGAQFYLGQLF